MITHDILYGAAEIALHLYGKNTQTTRQRIHRMAIASCAPMFRVGSTLCARRGKLDEFLNGLETAEANSDTTISSASGREGAV